MRGTRRLGGSFKVTTGIVHGASSETEAPPLLVWQPDHDAFNCITATYSPCHQSRIQKRFKSLEDYDIFMGGQHFITNLETWGRTGKPPEAGEDGAAQRKADRVQRGRGWQAAAHKTAQISFPKNIAFLPECLNNHQLFVNFWSYINTCKTVV